MLYSSFTEAPKTLDPAVAYTTAEHVITGNVYDTLLEYHYLRRPYQLIPGLAEAVPSRRQLADGKPDLPLQDRAGHFFHADPCFRVDRRRATYAGGNGRRFRLRAGAPRRPRGQQPGNQQLRRSAGLHRFHQASGRPAQGDAAFAALPVQRAIPAAGGIEGVIVRGDT